METQTLLDRLTQVLTPVLGAGVTVDQLHPLTGGASLWRAALDERDDLLSAFHKRLIGNDQIAQMHAAKAWSTWEGRTATLRPNPLVVDRFSEPQRALSIARIECHYFTNTAFLEPNQLIRDMGKIAHLPGVIIHGRYDVICPLDNAWELHQAWPNSELQVIRDAGHAASERGITDALVRAAGNMARRLLDLPPEEA